MACSSDKSSQTVSIPTERLFYAAEWFTNHRHIFTPQNHHLESQAGHLRQISQHYTGQKPCRCAWSLREYLWCLTVDICALLREISRVPESLKQVISLIRFRWFAYTYNLAFLIYALFSYTVCHRNTSRNDDACNKEVRNF